MLFKIIAIAVVTIVLNLILRDYKSDFAILVNVCGGLLIFLLLIDGSTQMLNDFLSIQNYSGLKVDIVEPIIKVIGIGYITEFTADLAEDSGNKSIADKVVVGGKIALCMIALPILKNLITTIISLV